MNGSGQGLGGDPVQGRRSTAPTRTERVPGPATTDNANMSTPRTASPPDADVPVHDRPTSPGSPDPFLPANGGDDAEIVYHEYTHGLSNRLVVDAARQLRRSDNIQAGVDGRGLERLVRRSTSWSTQGFEHGHRRGDGELRMGQYVGGGST